MTPEEIPPPPSHGITPEAAEALGIPQQDDTSSESGSALFEPWEIPDFPEMTGVISDGDVVDAEVVADDSPVQPPPAERARRGRHSAPQAEAREPKSGPPSIDEWSRFFSRVVLRVTCDFYLDYAFRGIDDDLISERDVERMAMTADERKTIATPFAEISNKSKFMRKHGRLIVASGDMFNAVAMMGAWASRVSRIAAKYKPRVNRPQNVRLNSERGRQGQESPEPAFTANGHGTGGGRLPDGFTGPVFPGAG
jgi:hypothetical protein